MTTIRLAIAGVGNCASSLVQGLEYYRDADPGRRGPGLMHVELGGYHIRDIEVVAAFDVDADKVGLDVGKAIWAGQNNTIKFADVRRPRRRRCSGARPSTGSASTTARPVRSRRPRAGRRRPGPARHPGRRAGVVPAGRLRGGAEVLRAGCLDAGVALRQRHPGVHRQSDPEWAAKFSAAGVPIVGDDIKSQVGATIVHRILARLFEDRGHGARPHLPAQRRRQHGLQEHARARAARVQEDLQDPGRHQPDRRTASTPTTSTSARPTTWPGSTTASGPTSASRAATSATCPLNVELKLEVWDSPNSAGVIIDALRCAKVAMDRGIGGPLLGPSRLLHEEPARAVPRRRGPEDGGGVLAGEA